MIRKASLIIVICIVIGLLFSGCGNENGQIVIAREDLAQIDDDTSMSRPLKVGFLCDITGDFAWYGNMIDEMGRAVVNSINEEGITGFSSIEVTTYDIASDQNIACEQIEQANKDGMDVVWGSWVEAQIIPFIQEYASIPYVMNNTTGLKPLRQDLNWIINPCASSWDYGLATAEFMKVNGIKTWAIVGQGWNEGWWEGWSEGIKYGVRDTDIRCVWEKETSPTQRQWQKEISEWMELAPDALIMPNPGAGAYTLIAQIRTAGYEPDFLIMDPMAGGDYQIVNENLDTKDMLGLIAPTNSYVDAPVWKEFATRHLEYDFLPYGYSAEMWDTLHLIKVAAEKIGPAGVDDAAVFMESLKNASYNGAMGHTLGPFRENGLLQNVSIYFVECVEGSPDWTARVDYHWKPVYKAEYSEQMSLEEAAEVCAELKPLLPGASGENESN